MSKLCDENNLKVKDNEIELLIRELRRELDTLIKDTDARLLIAEGKIVDAVVYLKTNLTNEIRELLDTMDQTGELDEIITSAVLNTIKLMEDKVNIVIYPEDYDATGDGECDDTIAIQKAIDMANLTNRVVNLQNKTYLISKPLILNGCTLIGVPSNIYNESGSVIKCKTNDFTAIKQGSTNTNDIKFNLKDIMVVGANIGFELTYVINSKYENLYVKDSNIGFKIGDSKSVGSMFNVFNNLYTDNCNVGIDIDSKDYFNNNIFNNGFIKGNDYSLKLKVTGGYGAVNNVFNNVEFRSEARGILLTSNLNTTFNNCYLECSGNAIRLSDYSSITLNNCVYGLFKKINKYNDANVIYAEGGGSITISGGTIFLTNQNENTYFFDCVNSGIYQNITLIKSIIKNGVASGFNFFKEKIKEYALNKEEQTLLTNTVTAIKEGFTQIPFTYQTEFSSIPEVVIPTLRGANNIANGLTFLLSEKTKEGGVITVHNSSTSDKSISFSIYAKKL